MRYLAAERALPKTEKEEEKAYTDRFRLCKLDIQDLSQRFLNVLNVLP
jgi:hypothetical protein